ncbi:MAG: branched-chain amino acid ABC transporter permease [Rhizobiaceae bacterium]|nr:branched-chain amino acid ABC transporter permease [Rhizobiaceae bacterium]
MFWVVQSLTSIAFGSLLFVAASGFALIFGLMKIPNLAHGSFFLLGAYVGLSAIQAGVPFWLACAVTGITVGVVGGVIERLLLRRLNGQEMAQVLATLGVAFIISELCLYIWSGNPLSVAAPSSLRGAVTVASVTFPLYRVVLIPIALAVAIGLWFTIERTRLGSRIRAGVDDLEMARGLGVPGSLIFTFVFVLGAALAGIGGLLAAPILSIYPGLDMEMLPLALIIVILGGSGSLLGALLGSYGVGFIYVFSQALIPDLAYVLLFVPMIVVLLLRPQGMFGRVS